MRHLILTLGHAFVILAMTFARVRPETVNASDKTCFFNQTMYCPALDLQFETKSSLLIHPVPIYMAMLLFLNLPSIMSPSRRSDHDNSVVFQHLLFIFATLVHDKLYYVPPTTMFAFCLHASVHAVLGMDSSNFYSPGVWLLRYPLVVATLVFYTLYGPSASVVQWTPGYPLQCALLSHLWSVFVPSILYELYIVLIDALTGAKQ
jgi:hypothetical protein